ncbi:MAG: nucleotide-diphospho-sugar transferase, partial [Patescibacteria group bacterium]
MSFNTPILFLIFNRPETTQRVFDKIKIIKPRHLFVAADGPREGKNESEKCQAVRDIIKQIDWDCKVNTLFRDKNLGCKLAVSSAIDWFFDNVEEGIILEDDCLPDPSFFKFCQELLVKYREDSNVMCISGDNFNPNLYNGSDSYFFSKVASIWGWASWRRAWKYYDIEMKSFLLFSKNNKVKKIFNSRLEQKAWLDVLLKNYQGRD